MGRRDDRGSSKGGWKDPEAEEANDSPFAALLQAEGLVSGPPAAPKTSSEPPPGKGAAKSDWPVTGRKVVVRREKKGRGGKVVTAVDGLGLAGESLERVARQLRKALGTGARVEDDRVVVQGDIVDRVGAWLEAEGVRRVVYG